MSKKPDMRVQDVPAIVVDPKSKKKYAKGKFLGKVMCTNMQICQSRSKYGSRDSIHITE